MITTALILFAVWIIALATGFTINGLIHILLAVSIFLVIYKLIIGWESPA